MPHSSIESSQTKETSYNSFDTAATSLVGKYIFLGGNKILFEAEHKEDLLKDAIKSAFEDRKDPSADSIDENRRLTEIRNLDFFMQKYGIKYDGEDFSNNENIKKPLTDFEVGELSELGKPKVEPRTEIEKTFYRRTTWELGQSIENNALLILSHYLMERSREANVALSSRRASH